MTKPKNTITPVASRQLAAVQRDAVVETEFIFFVFRSWRLLKGHCASLWCPHTCTHCVHIDIHYVYMRLLVCMFVYVHACMYVISMCARAYT